MPAFLPVRLSACKDQARASARATGSPALCEGAEKEAAPPADGFKACLAQADDKTLQARSFPSWEAFRVDERDHLRPGNQRCPLANPKITQVDFAD